MSAPDRHAITDARAPRRLPQAPQRYGTIVVVGGGCYGAYYVRQLARAARAGAIVAERVLVVDRDPACRVARGGWNAEPGEHGGATVMEAATRGRPAGTGERAVPKDASVATSLGGPPPDYEVAPPTPADHHPLPALVIDTRDWREFFPAWLGAAAEKAHSVDDARDAIVPSPLMPHLMYEWLLGRARARWPGRIVETGPLPQPPATPWERAAPDGTHYASFATWTCPINCIEPARCPHTRGPRDWSMPVAMREYAGSLAARDTPVVGPVVLHCVHRAWGVGMFDVAEVLAGDATIAAAGAVGPVDVLVGTMSHCHGAMNLLRLG